MGKTMWDAEETGGKDCGGDGEHDGEHDGDCDYDTYLTHLTKAKDGTWASPVSIIDVIDDEDVMWLFPPGWSMKLPLNIFVVTNFEKTSIFLRILASR